MRSPINTEGRRGGLPVLLEGLAGVNAGEAIERQEAQGQQSLVSSDTLPIRTNYYGEGRAEDALEAAGVKFLNQVPGDDLFRFVELPAGWKKVATGHSMWTDLVDDKGRKRASIFYKAAFYDRDAHWSPCNRYGVKSDYEREKSSNVAVAHVTDGDTVIFTTEAVSLPEDIREKMDVKEQVIASAKAWLAENFPDWQNPAAYWD